jgi:phosphoenolpyruvate carboxylase
MADYPVEQLSVTMRERIVLPITTIQQFAMARIPPDGRTNGASRSTKKFFEKLVIRCSFGIIQCGPEFSLVSCQW